MLKNRKGKPQIVNKHGQRVGKTRQARVCIHKRTHTYTRANTHEHTPGTYNNCSYNKTQNTEVQCCVLRWYKNTQWRHNFRCSCVKDFNWVCCVCLCAFVCVCVCVCVWVCLCVRDFQMLYEVMRVPASVHAKESVCSWLHANTRLQPPVHALCNSCYNRNKNSSFT